MITLILLWYCYTANVAPLWLAITGTVLEGLYIICKCIKVGMEISNK